MNKKTIVLKFGTGVLAKPGGCEIDTAQIRRFAKEISALIKQGISCVIVSSAAIASGVHILGWNKRPTDIAGKQAAAAVGQPALMATYKKYFLRHCVTTAQLLLTHDDIYSEQRRHNASETLKRLLASPNVVPIINENDSVATEELRFGDNDQLSAEVAKLVDAKLLVLVTSTDGLMRKNASHETERIPTVKNIEEAFQHVTPDKGEHSTGGMTTKLQAVRKALAADIPAAIINGRLPDQIAAAFEGKDVGTRFPLE
ncbi:MAG: glutamate 5-kinase [Chthoniobacterales bacterium]